MSRPDGYEQTGDYYYRRAEAELKMAQRATDANAVKAHYELANLYLEQLSGTAADEYLKVDR
jgi:hypothetical protein